jgi:hypothetical protein
VISQSTPAAISFELASRNTGLLLQCTRMTADRTLMAVIRTSLSLASFGFTIFELSQKLRASNVLQGDDTATPHFGIAPGWRWHHYAYPWDHCPFILVLQLTSTYPWQKALRTFA